MERALVSDLQRQSAHALPCPACGRATAQQYLFSKNGCGIVRCTECGLGRALADSFDTRAYYTEDYFTGGRADGYADYLASEPVLRREFAKIVHFIRRYIPSGKLLELGCAYGFFLREARDHFQVAGIELSEDAAAHARANGLNVIGGIADEINLKQFCRMDVIVLLDVIEHLSDPFETLQLCRKHLNPHGIIVLTTGDFGALAARMAGSNWRLMTPPQHLWYFTAESMKRIAARLGMRVEHLDHPGKFVPLSLILYQLSRIFCLKSINIPSLSRVGIPVNMFDAMRVVLRNAGEA
ncbi:MAG: class I SAM-dependent methyltransferase [Rhizobiales bacterium]|nr:class I SAM-dependent methyltransferase [Hyphomicrobiales bacterium]